ncbi:MAG: sigma-54-dependent Fis family transcriptional regulator [Deltaproteobacteria bacterium]|nr:sigma-54-dependent Fis family transcriptional regulator [Deltaproteobacteria bacterium]
MSTQGLESVDESSTGATPQCRPRVLVVDDEPGIRESLRIILRDEFDLSFAETGEDAVRIAAADRPDAVLLDIVLPGMDGIATLERLRLELPSTPVVMVTATRTVKTAVTAIKLGAYDYVQKPFDLDELRILLGNAARTSALQREVDELRAAVGRRYQFGNIVGHAPAMQDIFRTLSLVAPLRTTVLITGESGTGKELIARALHYQSPRAGRPMTAINCAAIPESLIESELFGHERGSFTGADARKLGQFELANGSTIFLDEVGELHPSVQAKLLRVLELGEFIRVGGTRPVSVDVRIVAASNRNLEEGSRDGTFRADLYYRLNVVSVHLPPLRERREDLPLLIKHFARQKAAELGIEERAFSPETIDLLLRYRWPGNVRELENLVERLLVLAVPGAVRSEELPSGMRQAPPPAGRDARAEVLLGQKTLATAVDDFERDIIEEALEQLDFNQTRAAERLGTTRRVLKYRMDKLGIRDR